MKYKKGTLFEKGGGTFPMRQGMRVPLLKNDAVSFQSLRKVVMDRPGFHLVMTGKRRKGGNS